jgi:large subunit ribosomal protein L5
VTDTKKRAAQKPSSDQPAAKAGEGKGAKVKGGAAPARAEASPPKKGPAAAPPAPKGAEGKPPQPTAAAGVSAAPVKKPERKPAEQPKAPAEPAAPRVPARLKVRYRQEVVPKLREQFRYRNVMEVPKLAKIVINMRVGDATTDARFLDKAVEEMTLIAGQKPIIPRAKKAIAAFKLRRGLPIAAMVTMRGDRMYEFVDKLFNVALPRIKDFKGISEKQFDGRGNLNIGVREQLIFPEIDYDKVEKVRGMDVTLVTTARSDEEARELLRLLGLPLRGPDTV